MELSDKVRLIIGAVVLLVIVGAGVAFFSRTTKKPSQTKVEATQTQEMTTPTETPTPTPTGTAQGQSMTYPTSGSQNLAQSQGAGSNTTKGGMPVSQTQSAPQGGTTSSTSNTTVNTATTTYYSWPVASQQQQQQQHVCVSIGGSDCSSSDGLNQSQSIGTSTQSQSM